MLTGFPRTRWPRRRFSESCAVRISVKILRIWEFRAIMGIMTGLLGCCSSSTLGSRANDYVKTLATLHWLHYSPCSRGCWTNNTLAARSLSPNEALCMISNPSVNSNWSHSPETLNSGKNWRLKYNRAPLLYYIKLSAAFQSHWYIQTGVTVRKRSIRVKNWPFCVPRDLEIWWITLKNNRAPLLYYIKLCAAFQSHWYIQTGVTVWKLSIWVKTGDFFVPCDLENWRMTLKNNRAPLPCCFKLCASFHSHWCIQTGVTVRKRPCDHEIWWMTLKNNRAPLLSNIKLCASFHHHMWIKLELRSGNG